MFIVTKLGSDPNVRGTFVLCRAEKPGQLLRWWRATEVITDGVVTLMVPREALRYETHEGADACAKMNGGEATEVAE